MKLCTRWNTEGLRENPSAKKAYLNFFLNPPQPPPQFLPPSIEALERVLPERRAFIQCSIDRPAITQRLHNSHRRRGAPPSCFSSIQALKQEEAFLIIAGQQPGVLGGPLYTIYKIIHAITLSRRLSQTRRETFLPAFWNASEDHDFDEIAVAHWLNQERRLQAFPWPLSEHHARVFFDIGMDEFPLDSLIRSLHETTQASLWKEEMLAMVRDCARQAESYPDFFDALLWRWFPQEGLIILRPDDWCFRQACQPLFQQEIAHPKRAVHAVQQASQEVRDYGLLPQIHKRIDRAAFFQIKEGRRRPYAITASGFQDQEGRDCSSQQLEKALHEAPQTFSPSAVLRPVMQDAVFPTAAVILGPGELGYHFLLNGVYDFHQVPRPCVVPRFGITLLEPKDMKLLSQYELHPAELLSDPAYLAKKLTKQAMPDHLRQSREQASRGIQHYIHHLIEESRSIDGSIEPVLQKYQRQILEVVDQAEALLVRRQAQRHQQIQTHLHQLRDALTPCGGLQERTLSITHYLLQYGFEFLQPLKTLVEEMEAGGHYFVELE